MAREIADSMHSRFSVVPRASLGPAAWDALCAESPDAWLFHTSCWLPFLQVEDLSFAVVDDDGTPLSLVVLGSQEDDRGEEPRISNFRAGIAHMGGLPVELRHELDRFALSEVQRMATSRRALRIDWDLPSLPPGPDALLPALRTAGYDSTIFPAKVVDLTRDEDALWRDYRKGCKSVIRRAEKLGVTVREVVDAAGVAIFDDLHARRMRSIGVPPGSDGFTGEWELLAPLGRFQILLATLPSGVPISGIVVLSYKDMAYYHAACSDPDHMETGGNTLLVHEAMLRAKSRGTTLFHLGPSPLASQVSEKTYLVGRFKNQFGGEQRTWVSASLVLRPQTSPGSRALGVRRMAAAIVPPGVKRRLRDRQGSLDSASTL